MLVPFTGLVADRFDRRRILFVTQSVLMLLAVGLGVLLLAGHAELWHLYAFALALGITNAFDAPARQSFVSDLVSGQNTSNAVALNAASFNTARLIGPAVAGLLIVVIGSGWVFIVNAVHLHRHARGPRDAASRRAATAPEDASAPAASSCRASGTWRRAPTSRSCS